jgi:hypothetical protein
VRRTVATLLVVASPLLLAGPVGAREANLAGNPTTGNPAPTVVPAAPLPIATPATPSVVIATAPAAVRSASRALAPAIRPAVKTVRAKAPAPRVLDDEAHAARLRADLCQARAIFCGLDRSGHYPAH